MKMKTWLQEIQYYSKTKQLQWHESPIMEDFQFWLILDMKVNFTKLIKYSQVGLIFSTKFILQTYLIKTSLVVILYAAACLCVNVYASIIYKFILQ